MSYTCKYLKKYSGIKDNFAYGDVFSLKERSNPFLNDLNSLDNIRIFKLFDLK